MAATAIKELSDAEVFGAPPVHELSDAEVFGSSAAPVSPTAPPAPDTPAVAPAMTPTSGTLPTTNVSPALAGPPSGTLPVSPETPPRELSDAEVFGPPLDSPVAFTDPALADTPLFPEGSQVGNKNQATPLGGFWNTFAPTAARAKNFKEFQGALAQDLYRNVRDNSAFAGLKKYLTGQTDAEVTKRRQALGMDRDPIEDELDRYAEQAYQQGGYESPDYIKVSQALTSYRQARDNPDFHWKDLVAAHQADPGAFWGEMFKVLAADPEFFAVPVGWVKASAAAQQLARAAGAGEKLAKAAGAAAGATGAAITGAAITAPVSAAQQLGESGKVDFARLLRETEIGAAASAALPALLFGAPATIRALRALRRRPGIDTAAVDAELGKTVTEAEQAARQAGFDPAAVRSELTRIVETPEGRGVVEPRADVLDRLPGEPSAAKASEAPGDIDLVERARATPRFSEDMTSGKIPSMTPERGPGQDLTETKPLQPESEEFKRWFGDSKVTDAYGNPFVVYHGGEKILDDFSRGAQRGSVVGVAFFSDDINVAKSYAETNQPPGVAKKIREGGVTEAYLKIKKPLTDNTTWKEVFDNKEDAFDFIKDLIDDYDKNHLQTLLKNGKEDEFWNALKNIDDLPGIHFNEVSVPFSGNKLLQAITAYASGPFYTNIIKRKFDGIIHSDAENGAITYVVFNHDQIRQKSSPKPSGIREGVPSEVMPHLVDARGTDGKSKPETATLYANPFLLGLRETARDIGLRPGRNLAAAAAGGVGGATTSEAEPGSAQWWLDVAAHAAATTAGAQLLRRVNLTGKGAIVDNARARIGDWIDNLPLLGRGPEELRDLKAKQQLMKDLLDRQTAETGKQLLERFSPSERAMMADLIETRGIIKDLNVIHRQAQALDDYLTHATRKMKELGMLPADIAEGGYLHRYYAKHLGLDKLFKEAKGQSLSGSWSMARGTDDVFDRQYFSPGAKKIVDEFEQVSADITRLERRPADLLSGDTGERLAALKARKRELAKLEMREFLGQQNGRLRSFLFTPDEVGRVDTGATSPAGVPFVKPGVRVLADQPKPAPGNLDARAMPVVPGVDDLRPTNYVWTMRGVKPKEALLHRDWTKYERQSWGEIDDAGYRYVRGMTEVSHDISLATLFKTVANQSDWVSAEPKITNGKPWVFVPDQRVGKNSPLKKYGALAGQYVRPDIWNGIRGYGRNALRGGPKIPFTGVGVGDAYLAALNRWKLYKTVYNPVTHFNNTYSNVEMLYMGGYSPADIGAGVKHLAQGEKSAVWTEARDAGLFGTDWTTSLLKPDGGGSQMLTDLAEKLRLQPEIPDAALVTSLVMDLKHWWVGTKQSVAAADGAWKSGVAIAQAMAAPAIGGVKFSLKPVKAAARAMQRSYQFEDNLFKMAVFAEELDRGSTPEAAVKAANDLFFNYQDVPEAIKLIRDLPVGAPFITYTYKAVPAIAKNIAQNPERVLFLVAAYEALNYAVLTADGLSPGQYWTTVSAEDATSPPWDRGRTLWGGRNTVHLPSPEGYRLALGRAHALGNPFMSEAGGREKLPNVPGGGSFWGSSLFGGNPLHSLLDVSVNEDWKGKEIYKPGAPADEKAQKIAAYLYQAWAPSNLATPGSYQQARVLEGLANDARKARQAGQDPGVIAPVVDAANRTSEALGFGQFTGLDRADNEIVTRDALLASFGVKLRPVRLEQSVSFETSKIEAEKKKIADWYRGQVRLHGQKRITDAQFAEDQRDFHEAIKHLNNGRTELYDAKKFLKERLPAKP